MYYIAYYCTKCKTEFILLTDQVKEMEGKGKYISCPFGHRDCLQKLDKYDGLKECFKQKFSTLI